MSDQQRDGITPFPTVSPDQIGNWYDGPETFVIAQAKDVQLGAQTYALTQPQAQQAVAVPAGFKLVPIEPTEEMLGAVVTTMDESLLGKDAEKRYREDWAAMLDAAPPPPVLLLSAWVSVDVRLPEKNTEMLVAFAGQSIASTGQYTGSKHDVNGWCYPDENRHSADDGTDPVVTHWQPLPAPPITEPGAGGESA